MFPSKISCLRQKRGRRSDRGGQGRRNPLCSTATASLSAVTVFSTSEGDVSSEADKNVGSTVRDDSKEEISVATAVLANWVDDTSRPAHSVEAHGRSMITNQLEQPQVQLMTVATVNKEENTGRSVNEAETPPFKFHQLIQSMWAELSHDDKVVYLGHDGQARVKGALTVLAAYGALREHPLEGAARSPQRIFSEMDANRDGEVSFDEFVRWYSKNSVSDETSWKQLSGHPPFPEDSNDSTTSSPVETSASARIVADAMCGGDVATPTTLSRLATNRLITDLKGLERYNDHGPEASAASLTSRKRRSALNAEHSNPHRSTEGRARRSQLKRPDNWPIILTPDAISWGKRDGIPATEAEKDTYRERWLAGEFEVEMEYTDNDADTTKGRSSVMEGLKRALEQLSILVNAKADAETLIAALASSVIKNSTGRYDLAVIEEHFGPIIRGIVEDRLPLERLPEPLSSASYVAIRKSRGVKAVLDLDDHHAKLMRDFLVHSSRDARAVVVHMADLMARLRGPTDMPAYARHGMALEALQLYVPLSNALGLGSSFRELEELGYKALFSETYTTLALWHGDVKLRGRNIVLDVRKKMLDALSQQADLALRVNSYRIDGRTKGLVSTFRKVFRQNKHASDVHDIIGLRIVVSPMDCNSNVGQVKIVDAQHGPDSKQSTPLLSTDDNKTRSSDAMSDGLPSKTRRKAEGPPGQETADRHSDEAIVPTDLSRAIYTYRTFPPPYRDSDSRLLHDVYEVLVDLYEEIPGRYKNYADFPKPNGYRSVHTTVRHPCGLQMELQVRTSQMHADAEGGVAAHSLYKGDLDNPAEASLFRSKMALAVPQLSASKSRKNEEHSRCGPPPELIGSGSNVLRRSYDPGRHRRRRQKQEN